ncbi:hypothetical protein C8J56DRAFT_1157635 [Mycena floridula]|nr:hypothetical protein C8J56DRAFT_1157635 [Mycena floridula]
MTAGLRELVLFSHQTNQTSMQAQLNNNHIAAVGRDLLSNNHFQTTNYNYNSGPKELKDLIRHDAAYNSFEREREEASVCAPKTREQVLETLAKWAQGDGDPVCWLYGPAGAGKSTIAQTLAQYSDQQNRLAFSYFFSRRYSDRSDLTHFIPTFTFELTRCLPLLEGVVNAALKENPRLFQQHLEGQLTTIATIAYPILSTTSSPYPMIVVIDGIDEYMSDEGKIRLEQLIRFLIEGLAAKFQLRILFTGRPEADITGIFRLFPSTLHIPLQDFPAIDDVEHYLLAEFYGIATKRNLGVGWPGRDIVRHLAEKTEGIFAYSSTLVRFIDTKYGDPRRNLETAMHVHKGLDSLHMQVLEEAQQYPNSDLVLGAVVLLQDQLSIGSIASLLQLDVVDVQLALRGCLSILIVPDDYFEHIIPYHTSLQDLLTDPERRQGRIFISAKVHQQIFDSCIGLIMKANERPRLHQEAIRYASQKWAHHLCGLFDPLEIPPNYTFKVVVLLEFLKQDCKQWTYSLDGFAHVKQLHLDLECAVQQLKAHGILDQQQMEGPALIFAWAQNILIVCLLHIVLDN